MIAALLPIRSVGQRSHRDPHFYSRRKRIVRRHHADDRIAFAVQGQRLIKDARLPTEAPLPQRITQDHNGRSSGLVFIVGKDSSNERFGAESGKQIGGTLGCRNPLSFTVTSEVVAVAIEDTYLLKHMGLVSPVGEVRIRDRHLVEHRAALIKEQ